jgi:hypothetical protein
MAAANGNGQERAMTPILISLLVSACVFAGGLGGLHFHRLLPEHHLTRETQEVIKLSTGMLSVLASLVLGLLIATAKTTYDATDRSIRTYAAELALLNEVMRDYGAQAKGPRDVLREYVETVLRDGWPTDGARDPARGPTFADDESRQLLEHVREAIRALKPVDDGQKTLQTEASDINLNLLRQRWQLIDQQGSSVQRIVLVILVSWVTVIFASFGINAPRNATVLAAFLVGAVAIGGAMFLILEMDRPLDGIMRVSSWPVRNVLGQMNW